MNTLPKTLVIFGFGPGISSSVAETFAAQGFSVALVARSQERVAAGVAALIVQGIAAAGFIADAGDPEAVRSVIGQVREQFGSITAIHWNAAATGGTPAGDFLTAAPDEMHSIFDVSVIGFLAAVQEALPELRALGEGAILVTHGAFGELRPQVDEAAVQFKFMGIALANAAKHKLVGLLAQRLRDDRIYVGEITIAGAIRGTPWGNETSIDPAVVAQRFWELYQARSELRARLS